VPGSLLTSGHSHVVESLCQLATPQGVMVVGLQSPEDKPYEGLRLTEIAAREHKSWPDALMDITTREKGRAAAEFFIAGEKNIEMQMQQPWIKFGTDADGADPDSMKGMTHPRAFGDYPRILGHYVRERHVLGLEDAVRKMTSAVAERLSIADRGILREGALRILSSLTRRRSSITRRTRNRPSCRPESARCSSTASKSYVTRNTPARSPAESCAGPATSRRRPDRKSPHRRLYGVWHGVWRRVTRPLASK